MKNKILTITILLLIGCDSSSTISPYNRAAKFAIYVGWAILSIFWIQKTTTSGSFMQSCLTFV